MNIEFNSELAEFVGIMLGDGYISYPKNQRIKISLNSIDDKEYIKYVSTLITKLFNINPLIKTRNDENTAEIYLFKRKIIKYVLNEMKLKPSPKWERAIIPNWVYTNNYERSVIRGLFDTDGCLVVANNNGTKYPRLEIKICPSPMQEQIASILKNLGFRMGVYKIGKEKIRIQINGKKELKKWIELIGFNNPKHLNKAKKFDK